MNHADKRMNPQHFRSDQADIRVRIRFNPETLRPWHAWANDDPLEVINFWRWSGPGYEFRITLFHFLNIAEKEFLEDLLAFLI